MSIVSNIFKNIKLRNKLLVSYFLIVLLPVVIIGYLLIDNTKRMLIDQNIQNNKAAIDQIYIDMTNELNRYIKVSDVIFSDRQFLNALNKRYATDAEYFDQYKKYFENYFTKYMVSNPDDLKVVIYTDNDTITQDKNFINSIDDTVRESKWFKDIVNAKGKVVIREPYETPGGKKIVAIGRLLVDLNNKRHTNILVIEIPESRFYRLLGKANGDGVYIANCNDIIVMSTNETNKGKNFEEMLNAGEIGKAAGKGNTGVIMDNNRIILIRRFESNLIDGWKIILVASARQIFAKINKSIRYYLYVCLAVTLVSIALIVLFSNLLTVRLKRLLNNMVQVRNGNFEVFVDDGSKDEIGELSEGFKEMILRINKLISEVYVANLRVKDLQIKKTEAEIKALQSQINPHFLFNFMESICMNLLKKKDYETCDIIQRFAKLLRKSIEWGKDEVTLEQELELAENYLKIQKFRYRDKFEYEININPGLLNLAIPKFTLQPIIENALYHGIERIEKAGRLNIYSQIRENEVAIIVEDNGLGIDEKMLKIIMKRIEADNDNLDTNHIGLSNVHQRLKLYYGEDYGISIFSTKDSGTKVEIRLPFRKVG
ncbi:MAG TPA: sensor histidine kinase [Clostridiaceae bacterium]|nr:sensor histidine kinase [Clostridiaceae bacterium]